MIEFFDFYFKVLNRLRDIIYFQLWRLRLKSLGKGSYIKKGVIIEGNPKRISIGKNFKIWHRCFIGMGKGELIIGNNGLLGVNCYLNVSDSKIIIGDGVAIAPFCQIYSYSHHYLPGSSITESYKIGEVVIEDDVLIGCNTVILPGVRIGTGAIVAAGSVVISDVESRTIVGGVPAKFIKKRDLS
jgi:acetyltransferase-like isoleucine patch superfamily enzyme